MKITKKVGIILFTLILTVGLLAVSGCKRKGVSLEGAEIIIGNFFQDYDTDTFEPLNEVDELTLEWRKKIEKENGFRMYERYIATYNDMLSFTITSLMAGEPAADIYVLNPSWAMVMLSQGMLYPVTDNSVIDFMNPEPIVRGQRAPEWNDAITNTFKVKDKSYVFGVGKNLSNCQVVFFNKRLFREAGLDPNLPYDMQKDGTWTWDNFLNICRQLTRDTDNDGIIDTYATTADLANEILDAIISSNGAQYVAKDENGRFINASTRPEFLEALQFAIRLNSEGVMKPRPESTSWDWYKMEFTDGNVAMNIDESYRWQELGNMRDEWGMVLFPKGPRSSTYRVYTRDNAFVIPAISRRTGDTITKEEVDQILYAFALWNTPQSDDWKSPLYSQFRDSRVVDETLEIIRDSSNHIYKNIWLVPGMNRGDIAHEMWSYEGDPAQLIEAASQEWNMLIEEFNQELFEGDF